MTETKNNAKDSINDLKDSLQNPAEFKSKLKKFVDLESKNFSGEIKQVKELATYLTKNWKTVVPTVAALALARHLVKKKTAGPKTGKNASKKTPATKKTKKASAKKR